jgi:hypothetical protein
MHILFIIQDWYVDVLFSDSKTNQLCQLAYDLFVSFNASYFIMFGVVPFPKSLNTFFFVQNGCKICTSYFI